MNRLRSHSRPPRSGQNAQVLEWLGTDQKSSDVLATARQLLAAEALILDVLPAAMARRVKVARIDRQRLTLSVPGAAHAARLRQSAPTLIEHLGKHGWTVNEIVVRVNAGLPDTRAQTTLRETRPLDAQALQAFAALEKNVRPGPLAEAISRLLKHHRG